MVKATNNDRWGFILNPVAGDGAPMEQKRYIEKLVGSDLRGGELRLTEAPKHATELAEDYIRRGFNRIVVVGGDGTIHEAAQAMIGKPEVSLGVVVAGTGNDYALMAGFSGKFGKKEWATLLESRTARVDVGLCNGKYFINGMGVGFDADVTAVIIEHRSRSKRFTKATYNKCILKTLLSYKTRTMDLTVDKQEISMDNLLVTCAIGRRLAGGYYLTPKAIANDGLIDVVQVKKVNLLGRISILSAVTRGAHLKHKSVDYFQGERITIAFKEVVPAHMDGELIFDREFNVEVVPEALNLIYNPSGFHYLKNCEE